MKLEEDNETQENINNLKKYPSFLFDNALSRYMNKLYDNKPSMDTSKISGKEFREIELTPEEIQYLKSITDGAKSNPSRLEKW